MTLLEELPKIVSEGKKEAQKILERLESHYHFPFGDKNG